MKNSERNRLVLENFLLHITHTNEGDHDANEPFNTTPNELYQMLDDYIKEDHVDGEGNPEDSKQEHYIAYKTNAVVMNGIVDDYHVLDNLDDAKSKFEEFKKEHDLVTAGIAKVIDSTDHV